MRERSSWRRFAAGGVVVLALAVLGWGGYLRMWRVVEAPARTHTTETAAEFASEPETEGSSGPASAMIVEGSSPLGEEAAPISLGSVSGQVIYVVTGRPVSGTTVGLVALEEGFQGEKEGVWAEDSRGFLEGSTDKEGRFAVLDVPAGEYLAAIRDPAFAPTEDRPSFVLAPGEHACDRLFYVTDGASITGRIYDDTSKRGVPGVELVLRGGWTGDNAWKKYQRAVSDSRGEFVFESLFSGVFGLDLAPFQEYVSVEARAGGGIGPWVKEAIVCAGEVTSGIEIPVEKAGRVVGETVDMEGRPVPGAKVCLVGPPGEEPILVSDFQGQFVLLGIPPGEPLPITARTHSQFAPLHVIKTNEHREETPVRLVMLDGGRFSGRLMDEQGEQIEDCPNTTLDIASTVAFDIDPGLEKDSGPRDLACDDESIPVDGHGRFVSKTLRPGLYRLSIARSSLHLRGTEPLEVFLLPGQELEDLALVCERIGGVTVTGHVRDTRGNPIDGAELRFSRDGAIEAVSDADGFYQVSGRAVDGRLHAKAPGFSEGFVGLFGERTLEGLREERRQRGRARPPSALDLYRQQIERRRGRDEPHGNQVPQGEWERDFVLVGLASIEGRVVSAAGGGPVKEFDLSLSVGGSGWKTFQDSGGAFVLERLFVPRSRYSMRGAPRDAPMDGHLREGTLTLYAKARGYRTGEAEVLLREGQRSEGVQVRLEAGSTILGMVRDGSGRPVSGAQIRILSGFIVIGEGELRTNSRGRFRLDGLLPYPVEVRVWHDSYPPACELVRPSPSQSREIEIILHSYGIVSGRVTAAGQPVEGIRIQSHCLRAEAQGRASRAETDRHGRFVLGECSLGPTLVTAHGDAFEATLYQTIDVLSEETHEVNFEFAQGEARIEGRVTQDGVPANAMLVLNVEMGAGSEYIHRSFVKESGSYVFEDCPLGRARLVFRKGESMKIRREVDLTAGTTTMDVDFPADVRVAGFIEGTQQAIDVSVRAFEGRLSPGEAISPPPLSSRWLERGGADTSDDGFEFQRILPGTYTLSAQGYLRGLPGGQATPLAAVETVEVGEDGLEGVVLVLQPVWELIPGDLVRMP